MTIRELIEKSEVATIEPKECSNIKTRILELKEILSLEKQIQIEIAKASIEKNNSSIKSDELGFEQKLKLAKDNANLLNRIEELKFDISVEKAKEHEIKKFFRCFWINFALHIKMAQHSEYGFVIQ